MTPDLRAIRLLLTDVDGVLTDGRIHFDGHGRELKSFHVHDAAGLVYWHRSGGLSGFVSGRRSDVVRDWAAELGVHEVALGERDKASVLNGILERRGLGAAEVAYVGDDILDLAVLRAVGFAVAPPGARREVLAAAHHVTTAPAGFGVVRETVETILRAQDRWSAVVDRGGLP